MITYGGTPLLIDVHGTASQFLAEYQSLCDLHQFGIEPVAERSSRTGTRSGNLYGVGLPVPNYPAPPPPRINQLYWPTGASRWSTFFALARQDAVDTIVTAASDAGGALTLAMGDDSSGGLNISTDLYLLPPRPVAAVDDPGALWILPLVDVRYWWQFKHSDVLGDITDGNSWSSLIGTLAGLLGTSITRSISDNYLHPDPTELYRQYNSLPIILDAIAHSVGQRLVRSLDGTVALQSPTDAAATLNTNLARTGTLAAGGNLNLHAVNWPEKVLVTNPKIANHHVDCAGESYKYEKTPASSPFGQALSGSRKLIHSIAYADFTSGGGTPDNNTALSALAQQICDDYYGWIHSQYDKTYQSMQTWSPGGFDDCILWSLADKNEDDDFISTTRVQSAPIDFGVEQQLSQDPDVLPTVDDFPGVALDNIPNGMSGRIEVYEGPPDALTDAGYFITCYNPGIDITAGDEVRGGFTDCSPECFKICSTGGSGGGGVVSVDMTVFSGITVSGNPVTTTGTLALTTSLSGILKGTGSGFAAIALPGDATQFLNGASTPAFANVKDSDLSLSNITTNNVSITKHGFTPILPNDASLFLDGTGNYTTPTGSGVSFANPSGLIGLTAVNGVAGTADRSDSTHALSQAIAPHWTGIHQFDFMRITDVSTSFYANIVIGSSYSTDRTLTFTTGDASRNITLVGNPTLGDWFDQTVKTTASPTFVTATLSGLTASKVVFTDGSKVLTSSGTVLEGQGGTGETSYVDGQLLIGDTSSGGLIKSTLTAGSNITIVNAGGSITISSAGSGSGTLSSVGLTAPAAGITVSGSPLTSNGSMVLALANDLGAVEALASTGYAVRTATDTWAQRTLTGTSNRLTVTNGSGVSGDPVFTVPDSAQLNIAKIVNLTNNGFVKTSSSDGTLSIDTNTYLTAAVTSIGTSNGITGGTITSTGTISGVNAKADGSTKGVATFASSTFSDDGSGTISGKSQMSITSDASGFKLVGDSATPGNNKYYGTNSGGTEGFFDLNISGAALTRTSDTNVILTLGGSPTTALVNAASLTLSWSGTLGLVRGGTAADLSGTGGTSRVLRQSSVGTAVTVSQLAAEDLSNGVTGTGAVVLQTTPTIATSLTMSGASPILYLNDAAGTHTLGLSVTGTLTANHALNFNFDNDVTLALAGNVTTHGALDLSAIAAKGDLWVGSAAGVMITKTVGTNGQVLTADSTQTGGVKWIAGGAGSVTSVDLTMPSGFTVSGNPVTGSGTLAVTTTLSGVLIGTGSAFSTATIGSNLDYTSSTLNLANTVSIGTQIFVPNTGLRIFDTATVRTLTIKPGEAYSANRTLTVNVGTADRSLTIGGSTAAIDQDVRAAATPSFVGLTASSTTGRVLTKGYFSWGTSSLALTGNTNDAVLTTGGTVVSMTATGDYHLTGLVGTFAQEIRSFINSTDSIGSPHTITIDHQNTSSAPNNRFFCPNSTDLVLNPGQSILFAFTLGGWQALSSFTTSAGTVTSVSLTVPGGLSVSGSPVTGTGTLAISTALSGVVTANGSAFSAVAIPSDATKFLNGASTPAFALVKDSDLSLSNVTTNNVTTARHGFTPILPNDASLFLNGIGTYTAPPGSGVTFANPSGLIGMTATNGVASTADRSDSTHAIDPNIAPHWTGAHQFDVFRLTDLGAAHYAAFAIGTSYTANHTLTFTTGDASRTVTFSGNPTLDDWFNQTVKTTATPTFVTALLSGLTTFKPVFTDGSKQLTNSGTLNWDQGGTGYAAGYVDGQVLIGDTASGGLLRNVLTAGANVTIVNGGGTITISSSASGTGGGTVLDVAVVTAHGFSGSVANSSTHPAITLSTTINAPVLKGDGTSISAATTTGSGSTVVLNTAPSIATSLTLTGTSPALVLNDALGTHTLSLIAGSTLTGNRQLSFEFDLNATLALGGDFTTNSAIELPTVSQGDLLYASASGLVSALTKNTTATRYLANTGTSNNPAWDLVNLSNGVTNILAVINGGTGQSSFTDGQLLIGNTVSNTLSKSTLTAGTGIGIALGHGSITITATGGTGGGGVSSVGIIPPIEGMTVSGSPITSFGNITLTLANDLNAVEELITTGLACRVGVDSWNTATITGTSARITVTNGDGVSGDPNIDISASYVGQTSITTLGTVTTGVWSATNIALLRGGTAASLSAPGANRLWGWDNTDGSIGFWTIGSGLSYDHSTHTLSSTTSGGSVTNFSAGNLSPLFTTSVATSNSTPALTFALSNAAANSYLGNATGSSGAPSYTAAGALTRTSDTNVILTLGGAPTVSLLAATSLTLSWSGLLGLARGGTAADLSATGGTGRVLRQSTTGASITVSQLAASDLSNGTTGSGAVVLQTSPTIATSLTMSGAGPQILLADALGTHSLSLFVGSSLTANRILSFEFDNDVVLNLGGSFTTNGSLELSTISAKGDLMVGLSSGVMTTKGVGANGQVLTADSTAAGGVKWAPGGSGSGSVTNIATANGITGGPITISGTISGINAAADNSTKGVATFTSSDFNDNGSGLISLDYTNGQSSSASLKGYLTSTDWTTFNNKVPATRTITTNSPLAGGGDLSADRTLSITGSAGRVLAGAGPAFTATPSLGIASSVSGSLTVLTSANTGSSTIVVSGSTSTNVTHTLPTQTGTFAVAATSPLHLNSTTGGLTVDLADATGTIGVATFDSFSFFDDGAGTITVRTQLSIVRNSGGLKLNGETGAPSASQYYGTNSGGSRGFFNLPTGSGGLTGSGTDNHITVWTSSGTALGDSALVISSQQIQSATDAGTYIDFANTLLKTSTTTAYNWQSGLLYDTSTGRFTINTNGCQAFDNHVGNAESINWASRVLKDTAGHNVLYWGTAAGAGTDLIQLAHDTTSGLHVRLSDGIHSADLKFHSGTTFDITDNSVSTAATLSDKYIGVTINGTVYKLLLHS